MRHLIVATAALLSTAAVAALSEGEWPDTDFTRHTVPLSEISSGGPGKDGIPSIDDPRLTPVDNARDWIEPLEPVILLEVGGDSRLYPLQIMTYHEIVNDVVGGIPVAVTFCPLCNAAIVFDRRVDDRTLEFGTTGLLRKSDLVMYDRETESWWQQFSGSAIVGTLSGTTLRRITSEIVSFEAASERRPKARVLSRDTGFQRPYGTNPYPGYDTIGQRPFLFREKIDDRLPAMERVLGIETPGETRLYPHAALSQEPVINDRVGDLPVLVIGLDEARSAVDSRRFADSRLVTSARAYLRRLADRVLTFELVGGILVDIETGTSWSRSGEALAGPLAGNRLTLIEGGSHFAFAWLAFNPDSTIYEGMR